MICEECHKHEASVHIQEIIGKKRLTLNLCAVCASAKGVDAEKGLQGINLATLLEDLAKVEVAQAATEGAPAKAEPQRQCARCGLSEADFRKYGRFGCAACYSVFTELLTTLLPEIHRGDTHAGKKPGTPAAVTIDERSAPDLHVLKADLDRAVAAEAYERAAELRDAIRRLTLSRRRVRPPRLSPSSTGGTASGGSPGA
jgi:protein arginine kinase activator